MQLIGDGKSKREEGRKGLMDLFSLLTEMNRFTAQDKKSPRILTKKASYPFVSMISVEIKLQMLPKLISFRNLFNPNL